VEVLYYKCSLKFIIKVEILAEKNDLKMRRSSGTSKDYLPTVKT